MFNGMRLKVFVATINDKNHITQTHNLNFKVMGSIEHAINMLCDTDDNDKINKIAEGFSRELLRIRNLTETERIFEENNLILDSESKLYELVEIKGTYFNERRGSFLQGISLINGVLSKNPGGV